ncbi:hypothetical protein M440DRAFT_1399625 [Trichoderma longibrachiatum ATCC 18648]|uniref:Uncharacterized protein n=1 Tax=Trichoderma longibrachiatum ATCC 18648 TaxID=983965 RepID=A0A2T4CA86_TRILO|nr:hypothetical protein M440DRAFT_1399625 [Trichoderma longibrachiatum ATCC 18648]
MPLVTAALIAFQGTIVCHFANLIDCTDNSGSGLCGLTRTTYSSHLLLECLFFGFSLFSLIFSPDIIEVPLQLQ